VDRVRQSLGKVVAYLLIVALAIFGLYRYQQDGERQDRKICRGQNEVRAGLVAEAREELDETLMIDPVIAAAFPPEVIARAQELARLDFAQTERRFAPLDCL